MNKFLVSSYYRGSLNVSNMRLFDEPGSAWDHACWCLDTQRESDTRIYIVGPHHEPVLIKLRPKVGSNRQLEKDSVFESFLREANKKS